MSRDLFRRDSPTHSADGFWRTTTENITRLRRFAVGILKSFQKSAQSIAEMMRKLAFKSRLVFDYLRMTQNSTSSRAH